MTMTVDSTQQRFSALNFDHMSSYTNQPHFTNPWAPTTSAPQSSSHGMYVSSHDALPQLSLSSLAKHQQPSARAAASSTMAPYSSIPVTAASADLMSLGRMAHHPASSAGYPDTSSYATAASPVHPTYAASASPASYDGMGYAPAPVRSTFALAPEADQSRRYSQSTMQDDRRGFADALEASHGMLSMSQETPRPIYGARTRGSGDSYGFPSTHSASSSVSSSTGFSGYYGGSIDSSVSDYSTAGSDIESVTGRTLPRPQGLMSSAAAPPPAPQSMMSQFSSKVSSSAQKKHKCKVCDKRFTRPSSLQTHMYSHTGEKPFCCKVEGCGRHFSVVSNLRRHHKVHKGQTPSEAGSEDHHSD